MRENFLKPLAIGFQANQEMQWRESEKKSSNHQFRMAMRNSRGEQFQEKFREIHRVHCIHTIYCFEAQEIKSPILQMVCISELKWRSYGHLKTTAPSWKTISQPCEILTSLAKFSQALQNFTSLQNFLKPCKTETEGKWISQPCTALRNPPV